MHPVEEIVSGGRTLAYLVRGSAAPAATTFVTPPELAQQVGFVVYPRGGAVSRHRHVPIERHITGTPEVILVRSGRCELDIFDDDRAHVATHTLSAGDLMIMTGGGHGFRMLEDTVLLEVKQGPYTGLAEKELF
jgi:hypothetical protein